MKIWQWGLLLGVGYWLYSRRANAAMPGQPTLTWERAMPGVDWISGAQMPTYALEVPPPIVGQFPAGAFETTSAPAQTQSLDAPLPAMIAPRISRMIPPGR